MTSQDEKKVRWAFPSLNTISGETKNITTPAKFFHTVLISNGVLVLAFTLLYSFNQKSIPLLVFLCIFIASFLIATYLLLFWVFKNPEQSFIGENNIVEMRNESDKNPVKIEVENEYVAPSTLSEDKKEEE